MHHYHEVETEKLKVHEATVANLIFQNVVDIYNNTIWPFIHCFKWVLFSRHTPYSSNAKYGILESPSTN